MRQATYYSDNKNVIDRVVNVCAKVIGEKQKSVSEVYKCRMVRKARLIVKDQTHALAKYYELLPSGCRYRTPKCSTVRRRQSFLPTSITLLNKKGRREGIGREGRGRGQRY